MIDHEGPVQRHHACQRGHRGEVQWLVVHRNRGDLPDREAARENVDRAVLTHPASGHLGVRGGSQDLVALAALGTSCPDHFLRTKIRPMIVEEAVTRRKFKKIAILSDSTNYGQLGRADLEKALEQKGVKAVAVEKFNIKDVDMTAQLLKAKEAGAEAILTYGIGPELAQIANGMTKLGWKVPLIGSWTLSMANYIDNAGPGGEGARMPETFIQEPTTPKRQSFIINYLKTFNPKNARIDSPVSAAQGYDSIYLLAAAIKQANSTDGPKIRAALEDLKAPVEGVVTTYNKPFTAKDHEAITANIPVFGEVKGGKVVYAYPDDQKKASEVRVKDANAKGALVIKK